VEKKKMINPCECGAEECRPRISVGPTVLEFDTGKFRVVCLSCWKKGNYAKSWRKAVESWNNQEHVHPLKKKRADLGLTQREVSEMTGVSAGTIYRCENGIQMPFRSTREKIEAVLGKIW
jgi:DNA-binding XRE family transcriptional regulator